MRVLIMGAGGTGAYYGAKLQQAGYDVTFLARGAHLKAIQEHGLRVVGLEEIHLPQVRAVQRVEGMDPADVILFTVKTYDTEAAAEVVQPAVGPNTMIIPLQNGIDSHERIGAILGPERVVGGLCRISVEIRAPGVIQLSSPFKEILFGEMDGLPSQRTAAFSNALMRAEIPHRVAPDIQVQIWKKFIMITALSGITGAARASFGPIRECPEAFALYGRLAAEATAVARAAGVPIDPAYPDELVALGRNMYAGFKASLLVDLERGRLTEVESLHGALVRLGRQLGVPTPSTDVVYALIKVHQRR